MRDTYFENVTAVPATSQCVQSRRFNLLLVLAMGLLIIAISLIQLSSGSFAQSAANDGAVAGSVPGGTTSGASSDAELWRQIRSGAPGMTSTGGANSGLLIQSQGNDWYQFRSGPLSLYIAWAMLGTIMVLALFFALRGRVRVSSGMSGTKITRFSGIERAGHWLLASSFIVLALTGLNLLYGRSVVLPLIGKEAFSAITIAGKLMHNYVAFAFMLGLAMVAIMWVVHNIPNRHDVMWIFRGGGWLGGGHPSAKKFNAGQKIIFWTIILFGISISMSGWALLYPFTTTMFADTFSLFNAVLGTEFATNLAPIQEQQLAALWHTIMAAVMIVVIFAHIYIGTIGMEGALEAMTSGEVDKNWAREHHDLWVAELEGASEKPPSEKMQPAE